MVDIVYIQLGATILHFFSNKECHKSYGPRREKNCLWGSRQSVIQQQQQRLARKLKFLS